MLQDQVRIVPGGLTLDINTAIDLMLVLGFSRVEIEWELEKLLVLARSLFNKNHEKDEDESSKREK